MNKLKTFMCLGLLTLVITVCSDFNELRELLTSDNTSHSKLVRIYIGENNPASRTIQPTRGSIAGYQLTFSGPVTQAPVNITEGNSAEAALIYGEWTITATAFRLNGTIGNINDAIASGSVTVNISADSVTVPPIMLTQSGSTGNGTLNYNITVGSGISGYMKLFSIDGTTPVSAFGTNGTLSLSNTVNVNLSIAAGRYIGEVRLQDAAGNIAFYREVLEAWTGATTTFSFSPSAFFDPSEINVDYGELNIISNNPSMIFYLDGVLTINGDGIYTIGMKTGITSTTEERIIVSSGVNADITLSSLNINVSNTQNACAFDMTGATVNLTLTGDNVLRSGSGRAGLQAPFGSTLVISEESTGSLTATGGGDGAGIGGGSNGAGGNITINGGTITATATTSGSGWGAAGIGGGSFGVGGTITINGGTVTATGGWNHAGSSVGAGIGSGSGNADGGTITAINGDAVVFASSIQPALPSAGPNLGPAIVFNGNYGNMYGNASLARNVIIPSGRILDIADGQTLTIQDGSTLTNNGTIIMYGSGDIAGALTGTPPIDASFTVAGDTAYTYANGVLTITGGGTYSIGMREGVTSTTLERIVVSSGLTNVNITLSDVNINRSGINNYCAFDMTGATVNLTLTGDNVLRSGSGSGRAPGRAGLEAPFGSTLVISGTGSLTATGGTGGAGIGGGSSGAGGTISITGGTVTATGSSSGAGIGGGSQGAGGTISIIGGTVTADSLSGAGIGGGNNGGSGTITAINGDAVVFASSIQPTLPTGVNLGPAIVFNGNNGNMYGNASLARNVIIPSGRILDITDGQTLTIQDGSTLTNNGAIIMYGSGNVAGTGTIDVNLPIDTSFTVAGGTAYTYAHGVLTITGGGNYTIGMREGVTSTTLERIVVSSGLTNVNITLSGVNINRSSTGGCAFDMTGATVNLTLTGDNVLRSGWGSAGLEAPFGSTLVISGTGSLTATGAGGGAGIGGGNNGAGGTINISGGTVTATGGSDGAGIGGGSNGSGGTVSITGGTIIANNNTMWGGVGIGIGGGSGNADGGTITAINGDAVVFASSIQPALPSVGPNLGPAIVFVGNNGTMYGDVTLRQNTTFASERILVISATQELTIPLNITLTNSGNIFNLGPGVNIIGTVTGNQPFIVNSSLPLTSNAWTGGNITEAGGSQLFSFTATAATQNIHVTSGTLTSLVVQLYDSNFNTVEVQTTLYSGTTRSITVTSGQLYYIRVTPFDILASGAYQIAFNTSTTAPSL